MCTITLLLCGLLLLLDGSQSELNPFVNVGYHELKFLASELSGEQCSKVTDAIISKFISNITELTCLQRLQYIMPAVSDPQLSDLIGKAGRPDLAKSILKIANQRIRANFHDAVEDVDSRKAKIDLADERKKHRHDVAHFRMRSNSNLTIADEIGQLKASIGGLIELSAVIIINIVIITVILICCMTRRSYCGFGVDGKVGTRIRRMFYKHCAGMKPKKDLNLCFCC